MRKKQNTKRNIAESIHKIYGYGMFVTAGFILGFDTEKVSIAQSMTEFIEECCVPICMVGLLYALPGTQLTRRLEKEGRLHQGHDIMRVEQAGDQCTLGCNFDTKRPLRDILTDYRTVLANVFSPEAYAGRLRGCPACSTAPSRPKQLADGDIRKNHGVDRALQDHATAARGARAVLEDLRGSRQDQSGALRQIVTLMAIYLHLGPFSKHVIGGDRPPHPPSWTRPRRRRWPRCPPTARPWRRTRIRTRAGRHPGIGADRRLARRRAPAMPRESPCRRHQSDSSIEPRRFACAGHDAIARACLAALLAGLGLTAPARADLQFCNKTSYVLDLALGLEEKGAAATRGWFRVDPGQCRTVLQGALHGREGLRPRPRAGRLRPLAAAAGRPRRLLHRRRQFRHRGRQGLPDAARASGWRASPQIKPSRDRAGPHRLSRRGGRLRSGAGARSPASSACW